MICSYDICNWISLILLENIIKGETRIFFNSKKEEKVSLTISIYFPVVWSVFVTHILQDLL